jgi:hypothetical protein
MFPAQDANAFYPIPSFINTNADFSGITIPYQPTALKNTFMFAILLTKTEASGSYTVYFDQELIPQSHIMFLNLVTDSKGEPIEGNYSFVQVQQQCLYTQFASVHDEIDTLVANVQQSENTATIQQARFLIDTKRFSDAWFSCQALLDGMLTKNTTTVEAMSQGCWISLANENEWNADPCCWELPAWNSDCKPKWSNVTTTIDSVNYIAIQSRYANL